MEFLKRHTTALIASGILLPIVAFFLYMVVAGFGESRNVEGLTPTAEGFAYAAWLAVFYAVVVIPSGIALRISRSRDLDKVKRYAAPNDWQAISDDAWKTYKRSNVTMIASPPETGGGFILNVDYENDITRLDGFSRLLYAMEFGDYLWKKALAERRQSAQAVREGIHQARQQWEQERLLLKG